VIKSKFGKSRIFPHLLATWLSATLKEFLGIADINFGIVLLLKIPWRKSLNTSASDDEVETGGDAGATTLAADGDIMEYLMKLTCDAN
jgi:hypothetical protein